MSSNKHLDNLKNEMRTRAAIAERTTVAQAREMLMWSGATQQEADETIDAAHLELDAWE